MINIVDYNNHLDDHRKTSRLEIKLKDTSFTDGQKLVSRVTAAFCKTTLLIDVGRSFGVALNPKRNEIVNLTISIKDDNMLSFTDIANFLTAFQNELDNPSVKI